MKVFISWSGERSRIVAEALREWLPNIINAVVPFVSQLDIEKGSVGAEVIGDQLRDSTFGIVCLTRDNQTRQWINYEAGALAKTVGDDKTRVATLLIDIDSPAGVTGPLSAFQATKLRSQSDMKLLVQSIARATNDKRSEHQIGELVDALWDNFVRKVAEAKLAAAGEAGTVPERKPEDMFGELLTLMRQVASDVGQIGVSAIPRRDVSFEQVARAVLGDDVMDQRLQEPSRSMLDEARRMFSKNMGKATFETLRYDPNSDVILITIDGSPSSVQLTLSQGLADTTGSRVRLLHMNGKQWSFDPVERQSKTPD